MIEILDTQPAVNVVDGEYRRLLGYPPDHSLSGRAAALADWAQEWYTGNGTPWTYVREIGGVDSSGETLVIDGHPFHCSRLKADIAKAGTRRVVVAAVSAGPELEQEAHRLWKEGRPDKYFFLEVYGSAVAEHLVTLAGGALCRWAEGQGMAVLPHYSPGYPGWDVSDQHGLREVVLRTRNEQIPGPLEILESGMLRPKKSLLAVFGLVEDNSLMTRWGDLVPCQNCSLAGCAYRRAPYALGDVPEAARVSPAENVLERDGAYTTSVRALRRWARERLTVLPGDDGTIQATFRYDGSTCSNMGIPLAFIYRVSLSSPADGLRILGQHCAPAPDDFGYRRMCRYMSNADYTMAAIESETPLSGQPLNDVLTWDRMPSPAGCYCTPASRAHKWGLVLETLHYALANDVVSIDAIANQF